MTLDPLWYKDAIFYELHVKAFFDSNGDGVGDFNGVTEKLDYLQELGIDCIWLLPFFVSPLKDDGYDIADYYKIKPEYGTLDDFKNMLKEAHKRNIKVISDLVINHTSDQHPWFIESRSSKDSKKRNYYVWSDSDQKYKDTRIIFIDTEQSNWTWDNKTEQFYWHRFFYHQPDLNYENPEVQEEMFKVMYYWLDMGLDGFRCDAVPYLFEEEGTNCENLPKTHEYLKTLRKRLDEKYKGKILLAEANQWPKDVREYFGNGDEFHAAFHFPIMPRIFMSLRKESNKPLIDIINQTPEIPENCQWCLFLRNHDELTLEMVTDDERDYMYKEFAKDPKMKRNVGICRRLAPLLVNGRRRIELLNNILMTFPGSPIIYYGDEIGMGDNIHLKDRDGVRTPMQWSSDKNAGFSKADSGLLYSEVINDPVYGYQTVNVETQKNIETSIFNWMKILIKNRKKYSKVFGRGSIQFINSNNDKTLAYTREYENEIVLVVNNLSRFSQPVELDLNKYINYKVKEVFGNTDFPPITTNLYFISLGPHSFYWFSLSKK